MILNRVFISGVKAFNNFLTGKSDPGGQNTKNQLFSMPWMTTKGLLTILRPFSDLRTAMARELIGNHKVL
jgi:hypothetical protein